MQDFLPLGTGNSRSLKSAVPAGTTWEQALEMLRNGTFPIDIGAVNDAGVAQKGTPLHRATLLSAETEALYLGLPDNPTPDNVFSAIASLFSKTGRLVIGEYVGTGGQPTIVFDSKPLFVMIFNYIDDSSMAKKMDAMAFIPAFLGEAKKPADQTLTNFQHGYIHVSPGTSTVLTNGLAFYTGGNNNQAENSIRMSGAAYTMMSVNGYTYHYMAILEG